MRAAIPWLVVLCTAAVGCGDGKGEDIEFSSNDKPFGRWPAQRLSGKPGQVSDDASTPAESPTKPPSRIEMGPADAATDSDVDSGREVDASPIGPNDPGPKDAGTKGGDGTGPRLTFSVLTQVQHMRLAKNDPAFDDDARGPENMGAIWISKPDGTFVRSLELWRLNKERSRHLVAYNKACTCPKPDVVATATLNKHREHTVSWDMSGRDGTKLPEGTYTLHIEVSDYDVDNADKPDPNATNAVWSQDFDTTQAPKTMMPGAVPFYTNLKLELLKP